MGICPRQLRGWLNVTREYFNLVSGIFKERYLGKNDEEFMWGRGAGILRP